MQSPNATTLSTPKPTTPIVNNPPVVKDITIDTATGRKIAIRLSAGDSDGDRLSFRIIEPPTHGQTKNLKSNTGSLFYTPEIGYIGDDKFTFIANDGKADSKLGTNYSHRCESKDPASSVSV